MIRLEAKDETTSEGMRSTTSSRGVKRMVHVMNMDVEPGPLLATARDELTCGWRNAGDCELELSGLLERRVPVYVLARGVVDIFLAKESDDLSCENVIRGEGLWCSARVFLVLLVLRGLLAFGRRRIAGRRLSLISSRGVLDLDMFGSLCWRSINPLLLDRRWADSGRRCGARARMRAGHPCLRCKSSSWAGEGASASAEREQSTRRGSKQRQRNRKHAWAPPRTGEKTRCT